MEQNVCKNDEKNEGELLDFITYFNHGNSMEYIGN
jgi:hypothetical protein